MKRLFAMCVLGLATVLTLGGCGASQPTPESLLKDTISSMNELATALESAKNVDEAKPKVEAIVARMSDLKKKADAAKIPDAKIKELETKMKPEMEKAATRMMESMMKLAQKDPLGMPKLEESLKKMTK